MHSSCFQGVCENPCVGQMSPLSLGKHVQHPVAGVGLSSMSPPFLEWVLILFSHL